MPSNLLILMSDEHQARAMGCAGHPFVQTPHLDALAARGTRFSEAYTPCPICVPARAAFAAGQPVHVTRLWDNAMPYVGAPKGWGHALQGAGVPVESIGKLHYRAAEDPAGFDVEHIPMHVVGGVGMVWASIRREEERVSPGSRMLGDYIGPGYSKYTDYDGKVTARTCDWLREKRPGVAPWCLFVGLVAPHFPLVVPQEFYDLYPLDSLPEVKLHPAEGHARHPWVEKQNAMMDSEARFEDPEERLRAMAAYYGLCSYLDANVGQIMGALEEAGLLEETTVIYTSDHGDNLGARGLWGKSNLYEESVAVPLIMAGPGVPVAESDAPVTLLDVAATIPAHFDVQFESAGKPLLALAEADESERMILSQYHAAGAVSGAYMLRRGRWKLNYYVGFAPELFDLERDPEEIHNLASDPAHAETLAAMEAALRAVLDPEAVDALAFADQAALIEGHGGITHLVFSHLHSDHMMDYARLVHAAWDEGAPPLKVFGPAPIRTITDKLFGTDGVFADDLRARTELLPSQEVWKARGGTLPRPWPAPEVTEMAPSDTIKGSGWQITSCEVPHAQPALTCMGFRLEAEGRAFVYSGDAGEFAALKELAAGADFMLHWCYRLDGEAVHPTMQALTPSPTETATWAKAVGVKYLALTHFRVHMDAPERYEAALSALHAIYGERCAIVEDLEAYEI